MPATPSADCPISRSPHVARSGCRHRLAECRQRRDAPYLAGHHGNAYHEGRQEGSTAAKAHPRKGCLNHEDSRDEQEHRPEERLQKAARDEAEDEANERDERILHDEGPTERIARKPHPFQDAPVGIAALYVRGRRVQAQDEGYHNRMSENTASTAVMTCTTKRL